MWRVLSLLLPLALICASVEAAEISVRARLEPTRVRIGESAQLSVEVSGAQGVPAPAIPATDGIHVRYLGPTTQISMVNGRVSASITHRFSATAVTPGTFTIGPIRVEYGGKTYDAGSVSIEVGSAGVAPSAGGGVFREGEQLRLMLSASKMEVYLHERVPVSVKLYVGNVRVSDVQYPTIAGDGFALAKFPEPSQYEEQVGRDTVQVVDFKTDLIPLRTGPLGVGPANLTLSVIARRRGSDPFFERFFGGDPFGATRRPMELASDPLELTVLGLPEAGKPADFSGAVGSFEFDAKAAPLELAAGDPVTITMTIRGTGNLENVTAPTVTANDDLRVYPPQQANQTQQAPAQGATAAKVFEQVVIPQREGTVSVPDLRFSYFDPDAREYRTIGHAPFMLTVRPPAEGAGPPRVVGGEPTKPRAEALGRDIVFIKETPGSLVPLGGRLYRSVIFWACQPLPLLLWLAAVIYDRRRRLLTGDVRYARFTRAGREARQALAGARVALRAGDSAVFYDTVAKAVCEYLSAKLDLPPGGINAETVAERLRAKGLTAPVANDLREFFATCERVRFAPEASADGDMQRTFEHAAAIIRGFERERRLVAPLAALALVVVLASVGWAAGDASPQTLFFRGNELYAAERYAEAAAEYEKILAAGVASGHLFFNLGNAYFKAGDTGRAILEYERARRLMPRDPDLHANLGYARTLAGETEETRLYERLMFPLAARMNSDEILLASSAAYSALIILLVVARLFPAGQRTARGWAVVTAVALAVTVSSAFFRLATVDLPTYAVVVAKQDATVRFEPSASGTVYFEAGPGSVLRVLLRRDAWAQVARPDGRRGWIERAVLEEI